MDFFLAILAKFGDISSWALWEVASWYSLVLTGLESVARSVPFVGKLYTDKFIPKRGHHLDELSDIDKLCINFNKAITPIFAYHAFRYCWLSPYVKWHLTELTVANTIGSLILMHLIYDLIYYWFHRILHHKSIYAFIHKHHHKQMSPTRGNDDAVNVHPFEFVVGEYLHLLCIYLVPCHFAAVFVFIMFGGFLASLNHTRFDISLRLGMPIFGVKWHDVHHRHPTWNYGQYILLYDFMFGTYKEYIPPGKVN